MPRLMSDSATIIWRTCFCSIGSADAVLSRGRRNHAGRWIASPLPGRSVAGDVSRRYRPSQPETSRSRAPRNDLGAHRNPASPSFPPAREKARSDGSSGSLLQSMLMRVAGGQYTRSRAASSGSPRTLATHKGSSSAFDVARDCSAERMSLTDADSSKAEASRPGGRQRYGTDDWARVTSRMKPKKKGGMWLRANRARSCPRSTSCSRLSRRPPKAKRSRFARRDSW